MKNTLWVHEIINSEFAVSCDDGEKVYSEIKKEIGKNKSVILSFKGIDIVTSAFLYSAIGFISRDYKDQIRDLIQFTDLSELNQKMVDKVIVNSKKYYENPEIYNSAYESVLEN